MLKKLTLAVTLLVTVLTGFSQSKNYPSLLWEISGNGMAKPSYLYGTMHVSNKIAFHLGDRFFDAINSVDEVKLELNPDTWLDDFMNSDAFRSDFSNLSYNSDYSRLDPFERMLEIKHKLRENVRAELADDPELINSFMFRSHRGRNDFEEDTYLDLYIYQTGKKLGKKVSGVETLVEMDRDQDDAEKAAALEDYSMRSRRDYQTYTAYEKIEEAYRRGDLDELDSLDRMVTSDSIREYIVTRRNVKMANRLIAEMRNHPVFMGVGAAHLPGAGGVIELLRAQGYTVRPIDKGETDARRKEKLENKIYPRTFTRYTTADSIFSIELPEKLENFASTSFEQMFLSVDMANGIYCSISRLKSYSAIGNISVAETQKMVDSLLYDDIPGKITEQQHIERDGVPGYYVLTKTHKGDYRAYNILFTNDEIIIVKVCGMHDNAINEFGQHILNSIHFNIPKDAGWQTYSTARNAFSISLPAKPVNYLQDPRTYTGNKIDLLAHDDKTGNSYMLIRTSMGYPEYFEEDTFELSLMAEDFGNKNGLNETHRSLTKLDNRTALKVQYTGDEGQNVTAMFLLQNLNYYALSAWYKTDSSMNAQFFNSVKLRNPVYDNFTRFYDTILHFSVSLPYKHIVSSYMKSFSYGKTDENPVKFLSKTETFSPPGSFESVEVDYYKYSPYFQVEDTTTFLKRRLKMASNHGDYVLKKKLVTFKDSILTADFLFADTNSTRQILEHTIVRNGERYIISAYVDTLLGQTEFFKQFVETFKIGDTIVGSNIFTDHTDRFLKDILSADSVTRTNALDMIGEAGFNNKTAPKLIAAVGKIPACKAYSDIKTKLYSKFEEDITSKDVLPFLEKAYMDAGDTSQYQFAILTSLAKMHTPEAMNSFAKLITTEPPLSDRQDDITSVFESLYDSLKLSKAAFPALLDLVPIEEYKGEVYDLLATMVDSNVISPNLYKSYKGQILTQAKLELKRALGAVKTEYDEKSDNARLQSYASLLMPFYKEPAVEPFFTRLLKIDNLTVRAAVLVKLSKNKIDVPDSAWADIAGDDKFRVWLYGLMRKNNLQAKFPQQYKTQTAFNESMLKGFIPSETNTLDTFVLLLNVPADYKGENGRLYLYKYKVKKDKDWKLAMLGLMPANEKEVDEKYELYDINNEYLDNHKTTEKQLREMVFKARKKNHRYYYNYD